VASRAILEALGRPLCGRDAGYLDVDAVGAEDPGGVGEGRLLARYGYPPDAQQNATDLVLRQMETFADEWSPEAED
jgi:hypothetical protein